MTTVEPAPGLVLDEAMHAAAAHAVARHAPAAGPLTWERFAHGPRWANIPDDEGRLSKSELVLVKTPGLTVKVNVWFRPDLRGGSGRPTPHNHPWDWFVGHVVMGGYGEDRWELNAAGETVGEFAVQHGAGSASFVPHGTYHEVTAVHDPGRTVSVMVCGPGKRGDWGYLDLATGAHVQGQPVAGFDAMFAALNPHLR